MDLVNVRRVAWGTEETQSPEEDNLVRFITDKILEKAYLDKWNGVLPNVVGGDGMGMILPDTTIN